MCLFQCYIELILTLEPVGAPSVVTIVHFRKYVFQENVDSYTQFYLMHFFPFVLLDNSFYLSFFYEQFVLLCKHIINVLFF